MERKIAMVFKQVSLKESEQAIDDVDFWLSKTAQERLTAVTFLIKQHLNESARIDRNFINQKQMKS